MRERISLQFIEDRLFLNTLIVAHGLRISYKPVQFAVDTGSPESFFSQAEVRKFNIPMNHLKDKGYVFFGGTKHKVKVASSVKIIVINDKQEKREFTHDIGAIETMKKSIKSIQIAEALPSVIGMDFLREHKLSLHVFPSEKIAYLESEE